MVTRVALCTFWHGRLLRTVGDHLDAMAAITSREEGHRFKLSIIAAHGPPGDGTPESHLGWLLGEFADAERHRLEDLLEIEHPLFGRHDPDPAHLLAAGMMMGSGVSLAEVRAHFGWDQEPT